MARGNGYGYSGKYSVSLYPIDLAVLAEVQEWQHLGTLSGALQYVIRRFADEHGLEARVYRVEVEQEPAAV